MTLLATDDILAERIRECVLELLTERGPGRSICPSEAARMLALRIDYPWQDLMRPVRTVAAVLADAGLLEATQHEVLVDIREVRGPIRLVTHNHSLSTALPLHSWAFLLIADAALPRR